MPVSTPTSIHSSELNEGASDPFDTPVFSVAGGADNFVTISIAQRFSAAEITTPPALYDDSDDSLVGAGTLIAQDGSADVYVGDWGWTGVPAGDYYIRVTGVDSYHIEVLEYTGVDQTTPTSDAQFKSYNDAGPPTTDYDVASASGDMVIACVAEADGTTVTESQTLVAEDTFAYGGATHNIQRAAGASTVNMDWTGLVVWASLAYNINAAGGGDTTAPTLTSPTATATGQTTASGSVSTDEANGTLYAVVTTSATPPSDTQVAAGQDHTGAAAVDSASQAVSGTGVQNISGGFTGLTAATTYYVHYMHEDAATNRSTVASSSSFTTDAADATVALTGTAADGATGNEIRGGGQTLIFTLTGASWTANVGSDHTDTDALIAALQEGSSAGDTGWDDEVFPLIDHTHVVRTSASVVTITLPVAPGFLIATSEIVGPFTIPAACTTDTDPIVGTDDFTITPSHSFDFGGGCPLVGIGGLIS